MNEINCLMMNLLGQDDGLMKTIKSNLTHIHVLSSCKPTWWHYFRFNILFHTSLVLTLFRTTVMPQADLIPYKRCSDFWAFLFFPEHLQISIHTQPASLASLLVLLHLSQASSWTANSQLGPRPMPLIGFCDLLRQRTCLACIAWPHIFVRLIKHKDEVFW